MSYNDVVFMKYFIYLFFWNNSFWIFFSFDLCFCVLFFHPKESDFSGFVGWVNLCPYPHSLVRDLITRPLTQDGDCKISKDDVYNGGISS